MAKKIIKLEVNSKDVTKAPESSALVEARAKEAELQVAYETIDKWGVNRLSGLVELLNRTRKVIQDLERL